MKSTPRYFIYARKSTDDFSRQVRSIGDQLAEVRELAARENLTVVDEIIEKQSAKAPGRPLFNDMLDRIERGEAEGILAWHPDRLSRNALDGGRLIHLIDRKHLLDLKFPTFRFEATAQGKFMLGMMLTQSKYYIDNLSENIIRGKRQKIRAGIWPQVAPMGYLNDRATRSIVPDPVHGPLVAKMFELYATGEYNFRILRGKLADLGLRTLGGNIPTIANVQHALINPIYYGVLRYKDELYDGQHTPLVSQALFDECRRVMLQRGRAKSKDNLPFLYRGQLRCGGCGCLITLEQQRQYRYVRCTRKKERCREPYVREELLAEQIQEAIKSVALSEDVAQEILTELDQRAEASAAHARAEDASVQDQIAQTDQRLQRLMNLYLDNAVSVEEYRQSKNTLVVERHKLVEHRISLGRQASGRFEHLRTLVKACRSATSIATGGSPAERWRFFKSMGLNMTLRSRRLQWAPREDWQLVLGQGLVEQGQGAMESSGSAEAEREREQGIKRRGGDSNSR